jgi:hypothetical protein
MFYNNQKHQWIFRAACIAGVAVEGASLLRKCAGPVWKRPIEAQLGVFLMIDPLGLGYVKN